MGELGVASIDRDFLNNLNPAGWSRIRLTRFETGIIYQGNGESSNFGNAYYSQTVFSGIMLALPISTDNGISFVSGLVPYSNVNYETAELVDSNLVDAYKLSYKGIGGLSKAFFGLSYRLPGDISIGSSFEYYTGKIQYSTTADFYSSSTFYDATYNKEYYYHGIGYTVGAISGNLATGLGLENLKDLRLGVTFSAAVDLSTDSLSSSTTTLGTVTNSSQSYKTRLPYRLGVGLSMQWTDDYNFMLDYLYQPMGQFNGHNNGSGYIRDLFKISAGMEYRKTRPESQSFWEHVMLRAGLSYEQTQYSFDGYGIDQLSVYGGLSVPMGLDNSVDFGFMYGKRGTMENNLLSENIYKFSITFSIGELWFIRHER